MTDKTPLNFAAELGAACGLLLGDSIRRAEVREAVLGDGRGVPGSRSEGEARGCGVASGGRARRRGRAACECCRQVRTFFAATRQRCRNGRAHWGGRHGGPCVTRCPTAESRGRRAGSKSGTGLMTEDDRRSRPRRFGQVFGELDGKRSARRQGTTRGMPVKPGRVRACTHQSFQAAEFIATPCVAAAPLDGVFAKSHITMKRSS